MVKVGDKIRYIVNGRHIPDWDGSSVTEVHVNGDVTALHPEIGRGRFRPDMFEVIEEVETDEELAARYRKAREECAETFKKLTERGYSFKDSKGISLVYLSQTCDLSITKTETVSI